MLDTLLHDLRYTCRSLRRAPGFSVVVVVTLALAVGANTALFSLFNAIVLRPLPVREPQRLAVLSVTDERGTQNRFIYAATFEAFRAQQRAFDRRLSRRCLARRRRLVRLDPGASRVDDRPDVGAPSGLTAHSRSREIGLEATVELVEPAESYFSAVASSPHVKCTHDPIAQLDSVVF